MDNYQNVHETVFLPRETAKKYFLQIGLGVLMLPLINTVLQYAFAYLFAYIAPNVYRAWWFSWLLSTIPLYCVAFPLFLYVLPKPIERVGERRSFGAGRLTVTCFISMSAMVIFNYAGFYLVKGIRYASGGALGNTDALNTIVNASPVWATVFFACIAAPIMEELIFRKVLIDRVLPFGEFRACLFSGLIFGMFHGNFRQFMYATVLGFIFSYVYVKTRNIFYSIGMHMGINLLGSVIMPNLLSNKNLDAVFRVAEDPMNMTNSDAVAVLIVAGTLLVGAAVVFTGVILFFIFLRKIKFDAPKYTVEGGKLASMIYLNWGTVSAMIVMAVNFVLALL